MPTVVPPASQAPFHAPPITPPRPPQNTTAPLSASPPPRRLHHPAKATADPHSALPRQPPAHLLGQLVLVGPGVAPAHDRHMGRGHQRATKFTSLPGTTTALTICLPSRRAASFSDS